jgi:hypothetical protein
VTFVETRMQTPFAVTQDVVKAAVTQAVATAFEAMVFIEPTRTSDAAALDESQIYAQLQVCAPLACLITLQMSSSLVDACVDALYCGIESNPAVRQDVVKELTNTVAGLLMSNLSESTRIELGLPQGGVGLPSPRIGDASTSAFFTEAGNLQVTVFG